MYLIMAVTLRKYPAKTRVVESNHDELGSKLEAF